MGVFGSRLWKCYRQRQTLPLDATSQATKPPSHVQRGSHCFCQPEPLTGNSPSMEVTGSKSGIRVFSTGFSLWGSNFKNMEKERFGATFCSIPHWWMILKGLCIPSCQRTGKPLGSMPAMHNSVQMHNVQSSICQDEGPSCSSNPPARM